MRILLVEDDDNTSLTIRSVLENGGHVCDVTNNGDDALQMGKIYFYDAFILDLGLPDRDGQEVLQRFREMDVQTPILILSGNQDVKTKIATLSIGADDYMNKPFHQQELLARLKSIVRRSDGHSSSKIVVGQLEIDLNKSVLTCDGATVDLTATEYKIMEAFMRKPGSTLTKQHFMDRLYGGIDEPETKIIDVFICKLRTKFRRILGPEGAHYIQTVWGRGYTLDNPHQPDKKDHTNASSEAVTPDDFSRTSENLSADSIRRDKFLHRRSMS